GGGGEEGGVGVAGGGGEGRERTAGRRTVDPKRAARVVDVQETAGDDGARAAVAVLPCAPKPSLDHAEAGRPRAVGDERPRRAPLVPDRGSGEEIGTSRRGDSL